MKSRIIKRSIKIDGHKSSVSLENEFWDGLHEIARQKSGTVAMLVEQIDHSRDNCNLSSAIRTFVFNHFRAREKMSSAASSAAVPGQNVMRFSENGQLP